MPATAGYQAGVETTQVLMSYAPEAQWATNPLVALQDIRITGESLVGSKTRARPAEINPTRSATQAVTNDEKATGAINYAFSVGTYDDFFASCLGADWSPRIAIAGVGGDISIAAPVNGVIVTIASTTAGKFAGISVGQWVRTAGFTIPANNSFWKVVGVFPGVNSIQVEGNSVSVMETPAGNAVLITGSTIRNGTSFKSLFLQKRFSPSLFFQYPGAFVTDATIISKTGSFINGVFTISAQQELPATVDASVGAHLPAPTGQVHDSVSNLQGLYFNGAPIAAVCDEISLKITNTGAAPEYGIGSASAQGMLQGTLDVTGTFKCYFRDTSLYQRFKSEQGAPITFVTRQSATGPGYAFTIPNATIMNPSIMASGPNQAVMASFALEGNPDPVTGATIQIDRMA